MEKSKLVELLKTFSAKEWRAFQDFVNSPYYNRNPDVTALCAFLNGQANSFAGLDRKTTFSAIFPKQAYNEAVLNHAMSFLLKLGETFIGLQQFEKGAVLPRYYTLQSLASRRLEKHYHYLFEKIRQDSGRLTHIDSRVYLEQYLLESLEANRLSQSSVTGVTDHVQRISDNLDYFYMAEKLRYACYMITSQRIVSTPFNLHMIGDICRFVENNPIPEEVPAIHAYFRIYQLLTKTEALDDFQALKQMMPVFEQRMSRSELAEVYQYAINYCNLQIIQMQEQFVAEALELYKQGIENGILLHNQRLPHQHFKNIIKLSLRLQQFEWTEDFILENTPLLEEETRSDALYYNLAELYYYTGKTDKAMEHLNKVEFTDVSYNLGAKIMLAKIYYENGAIDPLESLLHAFKAYLLRNKIISNEIRQSYLNFISVMRQMLNATPEKLPALKRKIENMPLLAAKNWLLKVAEP